MSHARLDQPVTDEQATAVRSIPNLKLLAAGAWGLFAFTCLLVVIDPPSSIDHDLQRSMAALARRSLADAPWLRPISLVLARLGSLPVGIVVLAAVSLLFLVVRRVWQPAVLLTVSYALTVVSVGVAKRLFHRPEPFDDLGGVARSFPSGHSASAAAVWGGTALAVLLLRESPLSTGRKVLIGVATGVVATVAFVMLARSAHWISDIVAGLLLGAGWLLTVAAALQNRGWFDPGRTKARS